MWPALKDVVSIERWQGNILREVTAHSTKPLDAGDFATRNLRVDENTGLNDSNG